MRPAPPDLFPFKGFPPPAHQRYTQVPNEVFDLMPYLDDREWRILCVMMRETYGWKRKETTLSLAEIQRRTGMGNRQVLRGLMGTGKAAIEGEGCVPKGLIACERMSRKGLKGLKGKNRYTVIITADSVQMAVSGNSVNLAVSDSVQQDVSQLAPTTTKKEVKEIEVSNDTSRPSQKTNGLARYATRFLQWWYGAYIAQNGEPPLWDKPMWARANKVVCGWLEDVPNPIDRCLDLGLAAQWALQEHEASRPREWIEDLAADPFAFLRPKWVNKCLKEARDDGWDRSEELERILRQA